MLKKISRCFSLAACVTLILFQSMFAKAQTTSSRHLQFDQPDPSNLVQTVSSGDATIKIYGSKSADELWQTKRDPVVFTAGTTASPYFYAQIPSPTGFVLCAESNYFDLDNSTKLRVRVTGLEPDTSYYFQVNDSVEWNRVRTAPNPGKFRPFQFVVSSDSQGPYDTIGDQLLNKDRHSMGPFAEANLATNTSFNITTESMRQRIAPDFAVNLGDIIEDARYTIQWQKELFAQLKYYLTLAPVSFTMGNHEYHDPRCWRYFEMPIPVFERPSERAFYSFTWGDAAFIVLDFNGGWYRIIDIDDMPSGTYVISDSVALQLTDTLLHEKSTTLKQLRDRPFTRQAISAELVQRGFSEAESRAVRTVSLAGLRDFSTYEIAIRNPKNGRISFSIPANRELFQGQWIWMLHELRRYQDKKYIFVFGHHPIRYGGRTRQPVVDLCERFGVSATFSGHRHVYGHHLHKNVHFFQAGGHSDTVFSSLADGPKETFVFHRYGPHYIVITVEEDQATVLGVGRDNQVFESTTIQPRRK